MSRHPKHPLGKVELQRMVSLTVLLPEALALKLMQAAKRLDRTVAELVIEAVRDLLGAVEGNG